MSATELLQWNDAATTKPDADITVLVLTVEKPGDPGEWWSAWWDDERECWIDAANAYKVCGTVTHWAEPQGPQPAGA